MKNRVLIFGAGGVGAKAKKKIEQEGNIVIAFSDNNELKWGQMFEECKVIPPSDINVDEYDYFAIGIYKAKEEIRNQLLALGVSGDKIITPVLPTTLFKNKTIKYELTPDCPTIAVVLGNYSVDNNWSIVDKWDFENNFWAFAYLVDDILAITGHPYADDWWKRYNVVDYDSLIVRYYYLNATCNKFEYDYANQFVIVSSNIELERLVHSKQTYSFWKNRLPRAFDETFVNKVKEIKKVAANYNIPCNEIAVVSGAVLQAYGLRDEKFADDIDIVMTDRFRELYGKGLIIVSKNIEMHPQNEMQLGLESIDLSDDIIINDNEHHFLFRGIKFLQISHLYEYRKHTNDIEAIKLMEWYGCEH